MPNNYEIMEYWKDKQLFGKYYIVGDLGEPNCWGCHLPIHVETNKLLKKNDIKSIWNKTSGSLQRCHIIPKQLGGKDTVDNLFLLCPMCHEESPDTDSKEAFLRWVYGKNRHSAFGYDTLLEEFFLKRACESFEVEFKPCLIWIMENIHELNEKFQFMIGQHGHSTVRNSMYYRYVEEYRNTC